MIFSVFTGDNVQPVAILQFAIAVRPGVNGGQKLMFKSAPGPPSYSE